MSNASLSDTLQTLQAGDATYHYYSLAEAAKALGDIERLPMTLKILLENQLRFADEEGVAREDMQALVDWQKTASSDREIGYRPARVLMQDFTGVPGWWTSPPCAPPWRPWARTRPGSTRSPGGSGHRPLGDGGQVRQPHGLQGQRGHRDGAQP